MSAALTYEESEPLMADKPEAPTQEQLEMLRHIVLMTRMQGARKLQRLTQQDVADRLGWRRYSVSDMEKGRSKNVLTMWSYGDAINTPLSVLIQQADMDVQDYLERDTWRQLLELHASEDS